MNYKILDLKLLLICYCLSLTSFCHSIKAAEKVSLIHGIFSRSITIEEIEDFTEKGIKKGFLKKIIKEKEEKKIREILKKEYNAPIILTSRLIYSDIGTAILKRVSKIIYPFRINEERASILALRASAIKAIDVGNEKINIVNFIKAYPSKVMAINVTELYKVLNKVESMSELMKFYSDSPLEKLKK
ncbi:MULTISPECIES: alpha/beta hydrolase [Prochlorococcus]|uniref:alpha/beta hydrolase n=1 Tax=Prochlorococcus TaxID=1218 RepID=UPI000533AE5F|nr:MULTISPECIES: alpha/beta hydrolase [Prochlorococcus]KGG13755.1 hypothetical protein EV05_0414 [Prochlorococcus sp. MIT 0601]